MSIEPPRHFDLQVNGYAGVDFNADDVTSAALAQACTRLAADGVEGVLATIITAPVEAMRRRIANLAAACAADGTVRRVIHGIHVEGPFINDRPGFVGTHPAAAVRPATVDVAEQLVTAGDGLVKLFTLAPECDERQAVTRWLVHRDIRVAAGHCDPSLDKLRAAIDAGLTMFTHLGNGCPLTLPRHDNVIQRVLSLRERLWVTFIADGVHVPFVALGNYLRLAGVERSIIVSDAIAAAGLGPGEYDLAGQRVAVDENFATWSADRSHLMGAATPINRACDNLVTHLGLSHAEAHRMTWHNPRAALGLGVGAACA